MDDIELDDIIFEEEEDINKPGDKTSEDDQVDDIGDQVDEPDDSDLDNNDYTPYYELLKELNVINTDDDFEFDGSAKKLEEALEITKNNLKEEVITSIWNALPEDFRPAFKYALDNKVSFQEYLDIFTEQDLDKINLSTPEAQRAIVTRYYNETSSFSPEKIKSLISKLETDNSLAEEAEDALVYLKTLTEEKRTEFLNKKKAAEDAELKQRKERTDLLVKTIDESITDKTKANKLKAFIFNPIKTNNVETTPYLHTFQNVMSNPEHFIQLADLMSDYDPKTGFKLERIASQVKTTKNSAFRKLLSEKIDSTPIPKGGIKNSNSDFNWDNFLNT